MKYAHLLKFATLVTQLDPDANFSVPSLENEILALTRLARLEIEELEADIYASRSKAATSAVGLLNQIPLVRPNPDMKDRFHKLLRKELKEIAKRLDAKHFVVSTNHGGVGVLGETTLMMTVEDGFGVSIVLGEYGYVRTITSLVDYTGGVNHAVNMRGDFIREAESMAKLLLRGRGDKVG